MIPNTCYQTEKGKEYIEPVTKLRREATAKGQLTADELVMIKTKSWVWKAVVVHPAYQPPQKKRKQAAAASREKNKETQKRYHLTSYM